MIASRAGLLTSPPTHHKAQAPTAWAGKVYDDDETAES